MFDIEVPTAPAAVRGGLPDAVRLRGLVEELAGLGRDVSDAERVDRIRALEELKAACAAAQARDAADLDASVRRRHEAEGLPARRHGEGVAAQVALARRESPHRGGRHLGLATALVREMPLTLAALTVGRISEWRATLLVRETACLSREDRGQVDRELCADPHRLEQWGDRQLVAEARRVGYRLDPASVVGRARRAESERQVTCRPAPDTMAYLTALLPARTAIAALAALGRAADGARASGDERGRGQLMADLLVERVTGLASAADVPLEVQLVMTDRALLAGDGEPALLPGYGPVPSGLARDWVRGTDLPLGARAFVRRLFTHPATGDLVALESRARFFPPALRRFLVARDQQCRTPWCEAPIRHADHVRPHDAGGPTAALNGQGLCERCNQAKQAPGWRASPLPPVQHVVETATPTGHRYRSRAPALPGAPPPPTTERSPVERWFAELVLGA